MAKRIELTEQQKIEILQRHAAGQSYLEIKKEMNLPNGQQIAGVLSTQHTPTGMYLLKKAGLPGPSKPANKPRKDLEAAREAAEAAPGVKEPLTQLLALPPPGSVPPVVPIDAPLATGGNPPEPIRTFGRPQPPPISSGTPGIMGFKRDGATEQWMLYRTNPGHGHIFTFTPPFNISDIGPRFGDGDYRLERWRPGISQPEIMTWTVTGQGEPRFANGAAMQVPIPMNSQPQESVSSMATAITGAIKAGADIVTSQQAVAQAAAAKPTESKATDKAIEKVLDRALEQTLNPPKQTGGFSWEDYIRVREQERKDKEIEDAKRRADRDEEDRRRRADEKQAHDLRMTELDKKHQQDMERLKQEATDRVKEIEAREAEREKLRVAHEKEKAELDEKKIAWAMKEAKDAAKQASDALLETKEKISEEVTKINATAAKERERDRAEGAKDREHLTEMLEKDREAVRAQQAFNEQLLELKKAQGQGDDKLMALGEKLLNAINDRTKDMLDVKKAEALLGNPNAVDGVVKNPALMNRLSQQAQQNNGNGNGEKDMVKKADQLAGTPEFKEFMEEWCGHVESKLGPEVFFDTIQRKYQQGDATVGEMIDFMSWRVWPKAKAIIWPHLSAEQQVILSTEAAKSYYEMMRALVNLMRKSAMTQWQKWEQNRMAPPPPPAENAPEPAEAQVPAPTPTPEAAQPS